MSDQVFVLMNAYPPSGSTPSQLTLGAITYFPNQDGIFLGVDGRQVGPLVKAGWTVNARQCQMIASGQTVTLIPGVDAVFDTSFGLATAKLPAAPVVPQENWIIWRRGTIPPVLDGNGQLVESFTSRGTFAATTTITQPNTPSTVFYNINNKWMWR
jgi:hypothetical protein